MATRNGRKDESLKNVEILHNGGVMYFNSKDVCDLLEFDDWRKVIDRTVDKDDILNNNSWYINIFGVAKLLNKSKLDNESKTQFKQKIVGVIIPWGYCSYDDGSKPFISKTIQMWLRDGGVEFEKAYWSKNFIYDAYYRYCESRELRKVSMKHFFKVMDGNNIWEVVKFPDISYEKEGVMVARKILDVLKISKKIDKY